jgi:hypothetical protein
MTETQATIKEAVQKNATRTYQRALARGFIKKPSEHTLARHGLLDWWQEQTKEVIKTTEPKTTEPPPKRQRINKKTSNKVSV